MAGWPHFPRDLMAHLGTLLEPTMGARFAMAIRDTTMIHEINAARNEVLAHFIPPS